jgi:undecaprenyl-diphosphatase
VNALSPLLEWDTAARDWLTTHHHPVADAVMVGASVIGRAGAVWIVIALAAVALDRRRLRAATAVLAAIGLAFVMTDLVVKPLVGRARPFESSVTTRVIDRLPVTASFPSGHAATAVAGAVSLSRLWPTARVALWALAALVALSRIYVGVHYPLDVMGGAVLGAACAWVAARVTTARP